MKYLNEIHKSKSGETHVLSLPDWPTFDSTQAVTDIASLCDEMRLYVDGVVNEKPTFARLVIGIEEIEDRLAQIEGPLGNLYSSMRTPGIAVAYEKSEKLRSSCFFDVWSNTAFYRSHRAFCSTKEFQKLGKEERSAFDVQLQTFKYYGVSLCNQSKLRLRKLDEEVDALTRKFSDNLVASLNKSALIVTDEKDLSGIPENLRRMMRKAANVEGEEGWAVLPKNAMRIPLMESADNRSLREAVYKAWATAASDVSDPSLDNRPIAERILLLRYRAAQCLGKRNHAERTIEDNMAGSPNKVFRFLNSIGHKVRQGAKEELKKLRKFSKSELGYELEPWDVEYAKNRFLKKQFGFTGSDLKRYITFPRVLKTLFSLAESQYGVSIKERKGVPTWLPHVQFFEVYEHGGNLVGGFYLDAYARVGGVIKEESLWTDNILCRRKLSDHGTRLPLVIIHLNMVPEDGVEMQYFSHKELIGFFHEFGHMLQDILASSQYLATSPTNVEWDVIEIPSSLMENWAWDIEILAEMTRGKRGGGVPLKFLLAIHRQRPIVDGYGHWSIHEYLEQSLFDLYLHTEKPGRGYVERMVRRVRREVGALPIFVNDRYPNNFPYIFGDSYDANMYGYLWSWRFAAAIRVEHLKTGCSVNPIISRRFRREFIEASRIRTAKDNLTAFFGRKLPSAKAMLEQSRML